MKTTKSDKPLLLLFTGAGFSFATGAPLMKDFLDELWKAKALIDDSIFERVRAAFYLTKYATGAEPNLETAYGAAIFREIVHGPYFRVATRKRDDVFVSSELGPRIKDVLDGFERAIAVLYGRHVLDKQLQWLHCYSRFFAYLLEHYRLGVVTTNYDLVCETVLGKAGLKWSYIYPGEPVSDKIVPILKLHGSVNWLKKRGHDPRNISIDIAPLKKAYMLPPTWNKEISKNRWVASIWREAVDLIGIAETILLCIEH